MILAAHFTPRDGDVTVRMIFRREHVAGALRSIRRYQSEARMIQAVLCCVQRWNIEDERPRRRVWASLPLEVSHGCYLAIVRAAHSPRLS